MKYIVKVLAEKEKLKGGQGDNKPDSEFDPTQLAIGVDDETGEHTPDPEIGKEIAKDHLSKDPDYYRKLKTAGIDKAKRLQELIQPSDIFGTVSSLGSQFFGSTFSKQKDASRDTEEAGLSDYLQNIRPAKEDVKSSILKNFKIGSEEYKKADADLTKLLNNKSATKGDLNEFQKTLTTLLAKDPKKDEKIKTISSQIEKYFERTAKLAGSQPPAGTPAPASQSPAGKVVYTTQGFTKQQKEMLINTLVKQRLDKPYVTKLVNAFSNWIINKNKAMTNPSAAQRRTAAMQKQQLVKEGAGSSIVTSLLSQFMKETKIPVDGKTMQLMVDTIIKLFGAPQAVPSKQIAEQTKTPRIFIRILNS